jgi:hypothetical protein
LAGLALMAATVADLPRFTPVVALLCVLWIPWNIVQLRRNRSYTLAADNEVRAYVSALVDYSRKSPRTRTFVFDGLPTGFHSWGTEGILLYLFGQPNPALYSIDDKEAAPALKLDDVALLRWNPNQRKLAVLLNKTLEPYLTFDRQAPPWQLGEGWYSQEDGFRWIAPHAGARLGHPPDAARDFELIVNVSSEQIRTGPISVAVALNGVALGDRQLTAAGIQSLRWPVQPPYGETIDVEFRITPEYRPSNGDTRRLGAAVVAFGFR